MYVFIEEMKIEIIIFLVYNNLPSFLRCFIVYSDSLMVNNVITKCVSKSIFITFIVNIFISIYICYLRQHSGSDEGLIYLIFIG